MRKRAWPFLLLAAASLLAAGSALAHERPPRAELHANGEAADISPFTYGWQSPAGGGQCSDLVADGIPNYRPKLSVDTLHARPTIVFLRDQRPRIRYFRAYSKLGHDPRWPAGDGKRVRARIGRLREGGEVVAWVIRFRVEVVRFRYFDLNVRFESTGGHPGCRETGDASYAFGLRRD